MKMRPMRSHFLNIGNIRRIFGKIKSRHAWCRISSPLFQYNISPFKPSNQRRYSLSFFDVQSLLRHQFPVLLEADLMGLARLRSLIKW